jgi:four helix bundle protein
MKENIIRRKSHDYAVRTVNFSRNLRVRKVEPSIISQVLRSGTSIAANVEEACAGISKAEFSMKPSISYKEAKENLYWITLLKDTGTVTVREYESLYNDVDEILRIL